MQKLRIGVLSTAKIGTEKVIPAMQQGRLTEVTAISSRSADKARAAAEALGLEKHYGSYQPPALPMEQKGHAGRKTCAL